MSPPPPPPPESINKHIYEKNQEFNAVTRVLHSTRYRNLEKIALELSPVFDNKLRVLDIGCGPCAAFSRLNKLRNDIDYFGVESNQDFCDLANERYKTSDNFHIYCESIEDKLDFINKFDLIIGLESFEHISENVVVRVIETIARCDFQRLYITVPNEIGPAIAIKNIGSMLMGYIRHREYTWKETFYASICELDKVTIHSRGHIGFDWRWLGQTLRQNVRIIRKYTSPLQLIPKVLSPSIGFLCEKRV